MSVLIKDMEKPKSCYAVIDGESEYCPFVNTDDDCVLLLKKGICEGTWEEQYSKCPLAEEPERKNGKWIHDNPNSFKCSKCNKYLEISCGNMKMNFCPNCGADMRPQFEEPEINPCRGCEDYDGKGGCKTKGGCADRRGDSDGREKI